jgi:spermidine/putrescine transport system substrate-binding protein
VSTDNDRFLGDYISNDWALKLDKDLIPNISNLIATQASPPFDPDREYSLPWFSGMDGIAWNEEVTEPVTSVTQLLTDPKLKGRVGVWNSMGDTLGLVMLENGDDPAKVTDESFDRAIAVIQKAQDAGQIRRFYGNDYAQPLAKGDLAASMAWSGDIFLLNDPKVKWGIAEKGGIIWTDNMIIPLGGSVPTASTYMNFVYDPPIAAQLALGAGYISSVKGAKDQAAKLNPDAASNTLAFPTDEMLGQMQQNDPAMFSNPEYTKKWLAVQGK